MKRLGSSIPLKFVAITCVVAMAVGIGTRRLDGKRDIGAATKTAAEDIGALHQDFVETLHRANDALKRN